MLGGMGQRSALIPGTSGCADGGSTRSHMREPVSGTGNKNCCRHGVVGPNPAKVEYAVLHGMASR